jgi:uncharacterized protein (TIGR00269 family)
MRCRKCRAKASVHMRQHRLALCKEHYLEWIPEQTEKVIKRYSMFYPHQRILVAVSGGKDSLSLWDILTRLGYQAEGLYIDLGIDGSNQYSKRSRASAEDFARQRGLKLHIIDVKREYGHSMVDMAMETPRGRKKVCSLCGLLKRYVMNRFCIENAYDVLATGHNLDDEAATLLGNTLEWSTGYLIRQGPVLPASEGLAKKVKPLFKFYEKQVASYAFLRRISYITEDCPYAEGATSLFYKDVLNRLEEERPALKLSFYLNFLRAKEEGIFSAGEHTWLERLQRCPSCGQPTTSPTRCAFCLLIERAGQARRQHVN